MPQPGRDTANYNRLTMIMVLAYRKLRSRLLQLGATELLEIILGDDQHRYSYTAGMDAWIKAILQVNRTTACYLWVL